MNMPKLKEEWKEELRELIKLKQEIFSLTTDKTWQAEKFADDMIYFVSDLLAQQREEVKQIKHDCKINHEFVKCDCFNQGIEDVLKIIK